MTIFRYVWVATVLCVAILAACNKESAPEVYEGTNIIYLETEKDPSITVGTPEEITVVLRSTYKALRDTPFSVSIHSLSEGASDRWVKVSAPQVILKKGERELTFRLSVAPSAKPTESLVPYEVRFDKLPDAQMTLKMPLRFWLINVNAPKLSHQQLKLIEGYREKGWDITPFLGKTNVKTTVKVPAGGNIKEFSDPWEKTYEGFTTITLSEHATPDVPMLKMEYNAMGMNDFFLFALRKETVENHEYWDHEFSGPLFKEVRELIRWNDKSVETFNAVLDSIRVTKKSGENYALEIVGNNVNNYNYPIINVPFRFAYTAWDRLKQLIDAGNLKAIECHTQGASSFPGYYINTSGVIHDEYGDVYNEGKKPLKPASEGVWLVNDKKMKFTFYTSVNDAGWYIAATTEYSGK